MKKIISSLLLFFSISLCFADELIIEPDMGRAPILSLINNAHTSIKLVMYGLTDPAFIDAINHAKQKGKTIQIILEPNPYKSKGENDLAFQEFKMHQVDVGTTHPNVSLVHQKTLLTDDNKAMIMTFNFTRSSFKNERNFALIITDPAEIQEINTVFNHDWHHQNTVVKNPNLVWSPNNSREKILAFIRSAHSDIRIYAQSLTDYQTIGALAQAARSGVHVQILLSSHTTPKKLNYLKQAGVIIHLSKHYRIHAKVILVDQKRALLGSINLTQHSLEKNRELSIITESPNVINELNRTFKNDF